MNPWTPVAIGSLLAAGLIACGGSGDGGTGPGTTLTAAPDTIDLLDCATGPITATLYDGAGNPIQGATFTYVSSAPGVASVAAGIVTAQSPGTAEIVVRSGALRDTVVVNVTAAPITLSFATDTISVYETKAKSAGVIYQNCHGVAPAGPPLVYGSMDSSVARLAPSHAINGIASGSTVVTVSNGVLNDAMAVTVRPLPGISGSPAVVGTPFGIAASASRVFVTLSGSTWVYDADVADPLFNQGPIDVGLIPTDVVFSAAGTKAYVTNQGSNTVGIIDVASRTQTGTIAVPNPFRVLLNASGSRVFVTTGGTQLYVITTSNNMVLDSVTLDGPANGLALSGDNRLYVTVEGRVHIVNASSYDHIGLMVVGGALQDVAVSPDDESLYLADETGSVRVWSVPGDSLITSIAIPSAFSLELSPDKNLIYVGGGNRLSLIERSTLEVLTSLTIGGTVRRIAFTPDGSRAFAANQSGFVTVIE
jgi:YVTN family beta-propeller protein